MKHILKCGLLLTALVMGLAFHLTAQSTQMTIYFNDGNEKSYLMTPSDRVYFEDNEILVVETTVTMRSDRYNLADIRKITCAETVGITEDSGDLPSLSPNPAHDAFILNNLDGEETIQIYALDGRLMKTMEVTNDQRIDISDLPIGLYYVKTERQTLKMIKL